MTPKYNFLNRAPAGLTTPKPKKSKAKIVVQTLLILLGVFVVAAVAVGIWFWRSSSPVDKSPDAATKTFLVEPSESVKNIGERLESDGVIRSAVAFWMYSRIMRPDMTIETGKYSLSPSMSMFTIIDILGKGSEIEEVVSVTFLPGGDKFEADTALKKSGFSSVEIASLSDADYLIEVQSKYPRLFAGWSPEKGLEGYFWGNTYETFRKNGPKGALNRALTEMNAVVTDDLMNTLSSSGRSFYESLILASIITREDANPDHQRVIAQIFLNRLEVGMTLGSDMTYYYGAKLLGVDPNSALDSPYNTRIVAGLTPTPIATPSLSSLKALANPEPTNALFFLSGDDNNLYTARTEYEHNQNIINYCHQKCLLP